VPDTLAPLQVFDVRDDDLWYGLKGQKAYCDTLRAWLRANGIEPWETYRWELYLLDTPFLKVFTYARDDQGKLRFRPVEDAEERQRTGRWWLPVEREPFLVPVSSLPPAPVSLDQPQEPTP
jgi:hypothetical protein